MTILAKDIMVKNFDMIHANASASELIQMIIGGKVRKSGHKTVSLMVIDDYNQLVGIVTMFDILFHFRPDFLNKGIDGETIPWDGTLEHSINNIAKKTVNQIMSRHIMSAKPDDHLMVVLDRMVKNKYRRLPVLERGKPIGIVYISDLFHHLFENI